MHNELRNQILVTASLARQIRFDSNFEGLINIIKLKDPTGGDIGHQLTSALDSRGGNTIAARNHVK
ncbi:MAG: hypothetical protein ACJAXK_000023 [Yoonia sp.]|jgi:hypothetical protein